MADDAYVAGLPELYRRLQEFPVKYERNVARGALRAGMNVVRPVAQQMARKSSGVYAEGFNKKNAVGTRSRGGVVTSYLKPRGPHAYLGKWIEFGTRPHNIAAKVGGWLSFMNIFRKEVAHPGARPFPHMRPALDSQKQAALIAIGEYSKRRMTKDGIDTSDIRLEGDE